jgi:hypothetical protein
MLRQLPAHASCTTALLPLAMHPLAVAVMCTHSANCLASASASLPLRACALKRMGKPNPVRRVRVCWTLGCGLSPEHGDFARRICVRTRNSELLRSTRPRSLGRGGVCGRAQAGCRTRGAHSGTVRSVYCVGVGRVGEEYQQPGARQAGEGSRSAGRRGWGWACLRGHCELATCVLDVCVREGSCVGVALRFRR